MPLRVWSIIDVAVVDNRSQPIIEDLRYIVLGRILVSCHFISNSVMASDLWLVICGLRVHTNNYVLTHRREVTN